MAGLTSSSLYNDLFLPLFSHHILKFSDMRWSTAVFISQHLVLPNLLGLCKCKVLGVRPGLVHVTSHSSIWLRCQASCMECPSPGRGTSPTDLQHLLPQPGSSWVCFSPTQDTFDWMMNGPLAPLTSLWETGLGPERHDHLPVGRSLAIRPHGIGSWKPHWGLPG